MNSTGVVPSTKDNLLASGATMGLTVLAGRDGRASPLVLGLIAASPVAAGVAASLCDRAP